MAMTVVVDQTTVQPPQPTALPGPIVEGVFSAPVAAIGLDQHNPRPRAEVEANAKALTHSLMASGQRDPIIIEPVPGTGRWRVFEGNTRLRAHQMLGWPTINVRVRSAGDRRTRMIDQLATHAARHGFDPITEARMFYRLMFVESPPLTREQVAAVCGYSAATVANRLQLLNLTEAEQEQVRDRVLPISEALLRVRVRAGRAEPAARVRRPADSHAVTVLRATAPASGPTSTVAHQAPRVYAEYASGVDQWRTTLDRDQWDGWQADAVIHALDDQADGVRREYFIGEITWKPAAATAV